MLESCRLSHGPSVSELFGENHDSIPIPHPASTPQPLATVSTQKWGGTVPHCATPLVATSDYSLQFRISILLAQRHSDN